MDQHQQPPMPLPSAPPLTRPAADMSADPSANCPCVNTACLGPYPSAREPLKAGLDSDDDDDDDSSIDSSSDHDDDDDGSEADDEFFFGDVDDFMSETESMFQKMKERFPTHHMSQTPSTKVGGGTVQRRTSCPSLADTATTEDTSSAMDTSDDNVSSAVPATIRGFHSYSTGALSRCHSSTLSLGGKSSSSSSKGKKSRRRVSISNDVEVKPIPERSEYSPDVRQKMWTSGQELYQNAARNTIEFASEGWNWRSVTEDEDMLRHTITRELIHPVHLSNAMELARQQEEAANSAAGNNGNGGGGQRQQQNPAEFMAQLPLERNDCSSRPPSSSPATTGTGAPLPPTPTMPAPPQQTSPPKISIPVVNAAATHAAVASATAAVHHCHQQTGPLSPPAATA